MIKQKTKKSQIVGLRKFFVVLGILFLYALFTVHNYGLKAGLSVTILTWAFFVFATPIADAGFLIAFPIRIFTGIKMLNTQIVVWIFGALVVFTFLLFSPESFNKTSLLGLFHKIVITPWPLWLILILSGVGTYVSIVFDDSIVDSATAKNKNKSFRKNSKRLYYTIAIFTLTLGLYIVLLHFTNTQIKII